ncbi:hypothetical protein [Nocardioides sp. Root151]|uniref:hypothetical protein n=1 Tax=Nocardioides sp. Root151 TaxID=1736475 RepID=UPI00070278D9|nr:hypothetical protein [Nocardioides sp. Root151]KQZ70112.1 hypothetical protein ASD66_10600 [Nocardioides sp. Root151]
MAIFQKRKRAEHRFEHVGALQSPPGFDELITVSAAPSGPVALWADATARSDIEAHFESLGSASFPETRTSSRPQVALCAYRSASMAPAHAVVLEELPIAHPLIQELPNGDFLVVGARCAWRPEGPERNALIVGHDGAVVHEGTLGDGIEHMLVDDSGGIWVGYFDEGIFGNFGWGSPGPEPLGSAGIVRWSPMFEKLWEYEAIDDYWLADCYALNVDSDRVWACPYTDFSILEIASDQATARATTDVSGPRALLIAGEKVALMGDYKFGGSLLLGNLDNLSRLKKSEIGIPDGRRMPPGTLVCRGSVAHFFVDADWFTFDLARAI